MMLVDGAVEARRTAVLVGVRSDQQVDVRAAPAAMRSIGGAGMVCPSIVAAHGS